MLTKYVLTPCLLIALALFGGACIADGVEYTSTEQAVDAPATVTATAVSSSSITVSWSAVQDARKYYVYQSTSNGPFAFVGTVVAPSTSRTFTNLAPSTTYTYYVITAHIDGTESVPSMTASATTFAASSGAPTNVTATTVSNTSIQVSWTAVTNARKYYLYQALGMNGTFNYAGTVVHPETMRLVQNLTPNAQYCYRLVTEFTNGTQSGFSATACATTQTNPGAPTNLTATAVSDTRINLQWSNVANAAKYYVYMSAAGGGQPFTFTGSVVAPTTTFQAVNLLPSTTYCFRVTAIATNNVESGFSSTVCATTFATGGGGFTGIWKFDERTGTTAADSSGFNRHGTLSGGAAFTTADRAPIDDNRSVLSIPSSATAQVNIPGGNGLHLIGSFTVGFWAKVPGAADVRFLGMRGPGCGTVAYEIAQDASNGLHFRGESGQVLSFGTTLPVGTWTHVAVTHASGTMRMYLDGVEVSSGGYVATNSLQTNPQVGAVSGCSTGPFLMDQLYIYNRALTASEVGTIGTLPPAPVNIVVTSKTSVSMNLAWDAVPGASSYIISKALTPNTPTFLTHSPASSATYHGDHLLPDTEYTWNVRAVVNGLVGPASNDVTDRTNPPPAAPTDVVATALNSSRIQITWSAVPGATKYSIFQSTDGVNFGFKGSLAATSSPSYTAGALSANTTYWYQIQAEDAVQTKSAMSASASATTLAGP